MCIYIYIVSFVTFIQTIHGEMLNGHAISGVLVTSLKLAWYPQTAPRVWSQCTLDQSPQDFWRKAEFVDFFSKRLVGWLMSFDLTYEKYA